MKQSWPWAKTLTVCVLAAAATQSGCDRGGTSSSRSSPPPTTATTADRGDQSGERISDKKPADVHPPKSAQRSDYEFEKPVRLRAGNEFVSVEPPGYACPTLADVDGDGKQDLVVGQFKEGNLQFCKNIAGIGEAPRFAAAKWIMTGDARAIVPGVW